jgi:hypothetical protein
MGCVRLLWPQPLVLWWVSCDPGELLCRLNRALRSALEYSDVPLFASAFYLLADLEKGELHYANAGHPNPLRVHCGRDRADTYPLNGSKHGPALGLFEDASITRLDAGDALRQFPGVTLHPPPDGDMIGVQAPISEQFLYVTVRKR